MTEGSPGGPGGPRKARLGHQPDLSTLPLVGLSQPGPTDPAGLAVEEEARLLGARCLRACQSGGLPIGGRNLLGKEGYSSAPGGLWHGLGLFAPFLLNQGKEVQDLPSFFSSWEGQRAMGYSGILLETVGEGLVPQGWA